MRSDQCSNINTTVNIQNNKKKCQLMSACHLKSTSLFSVKKKLAKQSQNGVQLIFSHLVSIVWPNSHWFVSFLSLYLSLCAFLSMSRSISLFLFSHLSLALPLALYVSLYLPFPYLRLSLNEFLSLCLSLSISLSL